MLAISRLVVFLFTGAVCLVAIPLALASGETALAAVQVWAPIFVVVELLAYFVLTLLGNPRMAIGSVLGMAVVMAVVRFIGCIVAAALSLFIERNTSILVMWAGNPIAVFLQVVSLILVTPHILAAIAPESMDRDTKLRLSGGENALPAPARKGHMVDSAPTGGFIQVFSYEELAAVIRKTQGLEGFLIVSSEGLIVWRDLPIRLEVDAVSARLMGHWAQLGALSSAGGLSRLRRLAVQTREHNIAIIELNASFGIILLYGAKVSLDDSDARVEVVTKTAREFLQWKYPGLSVAAALPQQSVYSEAS
ncbi:MAG: hypothetical protein PWP23_80 [Candidatus Sumerlaeota bacterium]|nr:hypothetical protein [Candidatus Sumerlaeota bacterium]